MSTCTVVAAHKSTMHISRTLAKSSKTSACNSFLTIGSRNLTIGSRNLLRKGQNLTLESSSFGKGHFTPAGSLSKHIKSNNEGRIVMVLEPPILTKEEEHSNSLYSGHDDAHQHDVIKLAPTSLKLDSIVEAELKEIGLRGIRRTKLVCTIGPACCTFEQLDILALAGMNIARLNMCHGTKEWHANIIDHIRKLNEEKGYSVAVMLDLEGSDIHMSDFQGAPMVNIQDWANVDFGIHESVDFIALPFAKPLAIEHLKNYISARSPQRSIRVLSKIESRDSLEILEDILLLSDGIMVARGELGTQISLEQVPSTQQKIVSLCRQLNRPVIVASQLLDSMTQYPTPTRAEVADVSDMVRQQVDALMLSSESAMGQYPCKSLGVLRTVSLRMEDWCRKQKVHECIELKQLGTALPNKISEEICNSAALMANELNADAIFVYTKQGYMASLLSRNRPECPIFAFTDSQDVRIHLNLLWGITPFILQFSEDMETNLEVTLTSLKARRVVKEGNLIIVVSDLAPSSETSMVQSVQIRRT